MGVTFDHRTPPGFCHHLPTVRLRKTGSHADRCLQVVLRVPPLPRADASESGRLLRVLFLRFGPVSSDSGPGQIRRYLLRRDIVNAAMFGVEFGSGLLAGSVVREAREELARYRPQPSLKQAHKTFIPGPE